MQGDYHPNLDYPCSHAGLLERKSTTLSLVNLRNNIMITFNYYKSQLKRILRELYALKAGDIPVRDFGICANLEEITNLDVAYFLRPCFRTWRQFSGDYAYPVPSPYASDKHSASVVYTTTHEDDMWNHDHPYGSLRLDLLEHLIRECEDAIDNGGYNER